MFTSWDSNVIGLKCGSQAFFYRISTNTVMGSRRDDPRRAAGRPERTRGLLGGYVVDLGLKLLRRLDLANPYEHASLGRTAAGGDTYHAVAFDPGPLGSGVGSLVTFDLATGASRVIVGPATGFPYPPTGTHVSALAYRQPGWVFLSIVGEPRGKACWTTRSCSPTRQHRVCRAAHHRSFGSDNTRLADPYWAEPHVVPSPSGTRAVFASDWGNGPTVDTYVVELPSYRQHGQGGFRQDAVRKGPDHEPDPGAREPRHSHPGGALPRGREARRPEPRRSRPPGPTSGRRRRSRGRPWRRTSIWPPPSPTAVPAFSPSPGAGPNRPGATGSFSWRWSPALSRTGRSIPATCGRPRRRW